MSKAFLIDLSHCNGCYNCQVVCKDEHCGTSWLPYAAEQPVTGQFWMRVDEKTRGQVPWVRVSYVPTLCAHCADAPCAAVCASDAFVRRSDGLLVLEPEKCTGCQACVDACPMGAIYFNDDAFIAQKCTGCAHLLDNGWALPRCADSCAHDAIQFKDEAEYGSLLSEAEALPGVSGLGPKVYYLHLPKRFVAGSAVDFAADEVVIGATVAISGAKGFRAELVTDELGDFKFDQIPDDQYSVTITAEGYEPLTVTADLTELDLSLGDLSLIKA
ncbi:MAG: carboxypeptidase regulatory-like domain-containing protein [Coriobacteriales bacterium]|jgi:Fe-S-cluster-containing dehydrogenase component|nr:carboxypeptidase regulatory-like domain-containing protein [Coriobacteriales bacterium]